MNTAKVKEKANALSELCIKDPDRFAEEYRAAYESGEFSETERDALLRLCDVYTAVKQGHMSREDGAAEQKAILSGGKSD